MQAATPAPLNPSDQATVSFLSTEAGADIEINGSFVGSTPTSLKLAPGQYIVTIRKGSQAWTRTVQVGAGSSITLNGTFEDAGNTVVRRARAN
jgi:hypothetical protein